MTMEELCVIEPRLTQLLEEAKAVKDDGESESFCANRVWYGTGTTGLKHRLKQLVGDLAEKPELRNSQAYDRAYHTVYDLLPPCRNCGCM